MPPFAFTYHITFIYFNPSLSFMILTLLKSIGQLFPRMSPFPLKSTLKAFASIIPSQLFFSSSPVTFMLSIFYGFVSILILCALTMALYTMDHLLSPKLSSLGFYDTTFSQISFSLVGHTFSASFPLPILSLTSLLALNMPALSIFSPPLFFIYTHFFGFNYLF